MITREQVADLQPGDVVRTTLTCWPGVETTGVVTEETGVLRCGPVFLRYPNGQPASQLESITVVSRASRPLYVNHPRTEPTPGDVASNGIVVFHFLGNGRQHWYGQNGMDASPGTGLHLLVDGETGQVVPGQPDGDPLAHIAKGDPTPEGADENPTCGAMSLNWACTRKPGHVGQHIAGCGIGYSVAAVWS